MKVEFENGYLILDFPVTNYDDQNIDLFLDNLNEERNIYELTTRFYLNDCLVYTFEFLKKFKNLKHATFEGDRGWELRLDKFPSTIETIDISHYSNTDICWSKKNFFDAIEDTPNLKSIKLNSDFFGNFKFPKLNKGLYITILYDEEVSKYSDNDNYWEDYEWIQIDDLKVNVPYFEQLFPHNKIEIVDSLLVVNKINKNYVQVLIK
jgi:hypothetical protein